MVSSRFLMVPVDSSAARIPLPGATSWWAMSLNRDIENKPHFYESCAENTQHARQNRLDVRVWDQLMREVISTLSPGGSSALPQRVDAGERLAFHPFKESAAGGGNVGEVVLHPGMG